MSRGSAFPTILYVRPATTQISLRIRAVWSESSQDALQVFKDSNSSGGRRRLCSVCVDVQADLSVFHMRS